MYLRQIFAVAESNASVSFTPSIPDILPLRASVHPLVSSEGEIPPYDFTGTYHDAGYGSFAVCNISSTSHHCKQVLVDFDSVGPNIVASDTLYAYHPRLWSTHLRFIHAGGNRFYFAPTTLFLHGYGKNATPFENPIGIGVGENGYAFADFVVEDDKVLGIALSGTVEEETLAQKKGGPPKDTADAWFDKI